MQKKWSLYLGSVKGIKIFIHWTFVILIAWIFLMHLRMGHGLNESISGVIFLLALFVCVVLHEFGHALTARRFNVYTKDITLYPIGGVASLESIPSKPAQELQMALAGPMVNLVIAALLWIYFKITHQTFTIETGQNVRLTVTSIGLNLMYVNVLLAAFNLIPAFPMDGGRVLRSLLAMKMEPAKATSIAARIGQFLAIVFVFFGFFYDFWVVFIGLFIFLGASSESKIEEIKHVLEGIRAKDVMKTNFETINPDITLETAAGYIINSNDKSFLVVGNDQVVGILDYKNIVEGLHQGFSRQRIENLMQKDFSKFDAEENMSDKFSLLLRGTQSLFPVMNKDKLVGVISLENVYNWIQKKSVLFKQ